MIITGAGLLAPAGSTSVMQISTAIAGYPELSTVPTSWRPTTLRPPIVHSRVAIVVQATRGTVRRHAADDLALEVRDDLGPPLAPPHVRRRDPRCRSSA
jgi:hypothetical protein